MDYLLVPSKFSWRKKSSTIMHRCKNNKFLKSHVIKNIRHVNIRKNETLQIFSLVKLQNSDLTIMLFQKGILENFEYWKSCSPFYRRKLFWIVIYFCGSAGKNPPAMRETWVLSLGWEDPLEKGKATHSSILAWRIPWTV